MADYRLLFDHQCLKALHLGGKHHVLKIAKVVGGTVVGEQGKKNRMPMVYFEGKETPLGLNRTNGKTIAQLYGNDTNAWVGKSIELYPTTTTFGRETVECIRVAAKVPQ